MNGASSGLTNGDQMTFQQLETKRQIAENEEKIFCAYIEGIVKSLPDNPSELLAMGWKDTTHPSMAQKTSSREYINGDNLKRRRKCVWICRAQPLSYI